jgi:hypothetical protein
MSVLNKSVKVNDNDSSYNEIKEGPHLPFWTTEELFKRMNFDKTTFRVNPSWHVMHLDTENRSELMLYKRAMEIAKSRYLKALM